MDAKQALSRKQQSIIPIAALASMTGTAGPLWFHLGAAMNTGLTTAQMNGFISVLESKVGRKEAESASEILDQVLSVRAK